MRCNGVLKYEIVSESEELNEYGEIVTGQSAVWSEDIPCSIKTNSDSRKGKYEDGEFRQASFTVLIEMSPAEINRVKLSRLGEDLGEYRVLSVEPLASVGRIRIVV